MAFSVLAACSTEGLKTPKETPYAPPVDTQKEAVDGLLVGWRLMKAGEYELALDAFARYASENGTTPEIKASVGTAYIGLGRLGQAEKILRESLEVDPNQPETWNNLGVILLEKGEFSEAEQVFRKAYALDDGDSDSLRDNLRLVLAKLESPSYLIKKTQEYKLVRRGGSDYLVRETP